MRLAEAQVLLANGFPQGAYYLGGYALELMLKARICHLLCVVDFYEKRQRENRKSFWTHDLDSLLTLSGLRSSLEEAGDPARGGNRNLLKNWNYVIAWSEECRYADDVNMHKSQKFIDALTNPRNGILPWLTTHF